MLTDFSEQVSLSDKTLVIGCSTSEVSGERIGTAGKSPVAETIFSSLDKLSKEKGVKLAFQCCEHLNRAIVVERETAKEHGLDPVSVIPVAKAGGSMATYAYKHMKDPVVVEEIKAEAGIDIGDTFIGMHLKAVAVPVRCQSNKLGEAHVTFATTRPKFIGGARATYA
ncbi:TIGR01440 family protein [Priestia endophytica]|uniref:TIGR01440 family protein n=1 Tax=Priestia endophytica TaxID=135735 RepID=UPI00227E67D8|nr:TIGR01440 family protein [Priestia endophytica]MCY8231329.1 TIGR01440 family protein [Priestia endophytica]